MEMKKLRLFPAALVLLAPVALLYFQNCDFAGDVDFTANNKPSLSSQVQEGGGDSFDGKPQPGDYIRTFPDYACPNSTIKSLQGALTINSDNFQVVTDNCKPSVYTSPFDNLLFSFAKFNPDYVVFSGAALEKVADINTPLTTITEALCQIREPSFGMDVVIRLPIGGGGEKSRIYLGLNTTSKKTPDFSVVKSQSGGRTYFISQEYNFELSMSDFSPDNRVFAGKVKAEVDHQVFEASANCRRMNTEPMLMVTAIAVGLEHSCAIVNESVQCWGGNSRHQLGQGASTAPSNVPLKVPGLDSGVTGLAIGYTHTCAIQYGNVKCWGRNNAAESGSLVASDVQTPNLILTSTGVPLTNVTRVTLGFSHSCAISNGAAYCWGENVSGELGIVETAGQLFDAPSSNARADANPVLDLGSGVTDLALGNMHSCAVVNGGVKCWGANDHRGSADPNEIGVRILGADPANYKVGYPFDFTVVNNPGIRCQPRPIQVTGLGDNSGAVKIAATSLATCVTMANGSVKCWGRGFEALGQGAAIPPGGASNTPLDVLNLSGVSAIGSLMNGFCAISQGALNCWGRANTYNIFAVPNGVNNPVSTPTPAIGLSSGVSYFAGGSIDEGYHGCAIANRQAQCWGRNIEGQLGDGTNTSQNNGPIAVTRWQ